jgi:hypothetical protein
VIYCGCCPWTHCPNMKPADDALHAMGFTKVKSLSIGSTKATPSPKENRLMWVRPPYGCPAKRRNRAPTA